MSHRKRKWSGGKKKLKKRGEKKLDGNKEGEESKGKFSKLKTYAR